MAKTISELFYEQNGITEECVPGTWTYSMENAIKVGKENNRFILVDFSKSSGCGFCNSAWNSIYSKQEFLQWSKDNGIPILYADVLDVTNFYNGDILTNWLFYTYWSVSQIGLPQIMLLDPLMIEKKNKPTCLMKFFISGASFVFPTKGGYDKVIVKNQNYFDDRCANSEYFTPYTADKIFEIIQYLFCQQQQSFEYTLEVSEGNKVGQFGDYGIRTLGCHNHWTYNSLIPKIKLMCYSSSQFHWFKFTGTKDTKYKISISDYVDSENCGKCLIFYDSAKAENSNTYKNALQNCSLQFNMSDQITFNSDGKETYILFTRKDDVQEEFESTNGTKYTGYHEFDLTYTFKIVQCGDSSGEHGDGNINNIVNDSTLTEFKTGQWYGVKCAKNLKTYADKTNIPVFIVRSGSPCERCENFKANTLKKSSNFDSIAKTNALFLYYTDSETYPVSHISGTKNDTVNLGKYISDLNYTRDLRTFYLNGTYSVDYIAPWPIITGYHNLGNGTTIMSRGTVNSNTYELDTTSKANRTQWNSSTTDINYYLQRFISQFQITETVKTYSVTFYDYDKTVLKEAQQVSANMDAIPPQNPTRENYDFTGWNPDYTNVTQNLSCIAQYKKTDVSNPITKNYCFGLKKDCVLTTGDGISFQYDYNTNSLYRVNI